jgi:acylphosphatase
MEQEGRRRTRATVTGRVQGVGFRWHVHRAACARALGGWVRNRPDGTVELEVEGPGPLVASFIDDVRQGPAAARVDDVVTEDVEPEGEDGFSIRY